MSDISYPQGCKPIRDDLGPDELIRRLKVSVTIFHIQNPVSRRQLDIFN